MSGNGKGLGSPKGMKLVNLAYGFGAAIVIVGALMKLMHWPGWDTFLPLGMGAEAILFIIGAFEPPHHEGTKWDWSTIYPEIGKEKSPLDILEEQKAGTKNLTKKTEEISKAEAGLKAANTSLPTPTRRTATPSGATSGLTDEDMKKWNESVNKISETADNISKMSKIGDVSESYLKKLDNAGNAVESLAQVQEASADLLNTSTNELAKNYKKAAVSIEGADENLIANYQGVSEALASHKDVFFKANESTNKEINTVKQNLTAINSIYELQLNTVKEELKAKEEQNKAQTSINEQLALMQQALLTAVASNETYAKESQKLESNIAELNNVYGNMLSSLN